MLRNPHPGVDPIGLYGSRRGRGRKVVADEDRPLDTTALDAHVRSRRPVQDHVQVRDSLDSLRVTYDSEVDAAYIYFVPEIEPGGVAGTIPVDAGDHPWVINLDVDSDGRLLGIEVLEARRLLPPSLLGR